MLDSITVANTATEVPTEIAIIGNLNDIDFDFLLVQNGSDLMYSQIHNEPHDNWKMENYDLGRMVGRDTSDVVDPFAFGPGSPARQGAEHE
jgi:hypothetical protein